MRAVDAAEPCHGEAAPCPECAGKAHAVHRGRDRPGVRSWPAGFCFSGTIVGSGGDAIDPCAAAPLAGYREALLLLQAPTSTRTLCLPVSAFVSCSIVAPSVAAASLPAGRAWSRLRRRLWCFDRSGLLRGGLLMFCHHRLRAVVSGPWPVSHARFPGEASQVKERIIPLRRAARPSHIVAANVRSRSNSCPVENTRFDRDTRSPSDLQSGPHVVPSAILVQPSTVQVKTDGPTTRPPA